MLMCALAYRSTCLQRAPSRTVGHTLLQGFQSEAAAVASAAVTSFVSGGVAECINTDIHYSGVIHYVASATNVLGAVHPAPLSCPALFVLNWFNWWENPPPAAPRNSASGRLWPMRHKRRKCAAELKTAMEGTRISQPFTIRNKSTIALLRARAREQFHCVATCCITNNRTP